MAMKKLSASSRREKLHHGNRGSMPKTSMAKMVTVEHTPGKPLTAKQKRELASLAALPDDQIDTTDLPELPPGAWKNAARGLFYRPVKQAVSLRLDFDIVAWVNEE